MMRQFQAMQIKHAEGESQCGFIDQEGAFYTRVQAWVIAEREGQIRNRTNGDTNNGGTLFSENLY